MEGPTEYIYILIDQRDNSIRYVGRARNPTKRLHGHRAWYARAAAAGGDGCRYDQWILDVHKAGASFDMEVVMEVRPEYADFAEALCMEFFTKAGCGLVNTKPSFGAKGRDALLALRQKLGMTQAAFAEEVGKSLRQIQYYEAGRVGVPKNVERLLGTIEREYNLQEMVNVFLAEYDGLSES